MIRLCEPEDFNAIWTIVNDGAEAYRGMIPADRWHEPYMTQGQLRAEIGAGVTFWVAENQGALQGVMGIQNVQDVTLIRHAYVRTSERRNGIGGLLLSHLQTLTNRTILIGTWTDASWAVHFYQKNGYEVVPADLKDKLLKRYWNVPTRQIETSTVLVRGPIPLQPE